MLIVLPSEMWSYGATTTGTVGADYEAQWLTDSIPGRPARTVGGSPGGLALDINGPAGDVGIVAIHHHNLVVPVTIGGDVTATITPATTRPPHGIQLDAFSLVTPAVSGVDHLTFASSGNDEDEIVGEFLAGKVREMTPLKVDDAEFSADAFIDGPLGLFQSVMPYDTGQEQRVLKGSQYYSNADTALLRQMYQGQRGGTKPILLIPYPGVNDAWLVFMKAFRFKAFPQDMDRNLVSFEFVEYPRSRW